MRKKTKKQIVISDSKSSDVLMNAFLDDVVKINNLMKIRTVLKNYNVITNVSQITAMAIAELNGEIFKKVNNLSANIVEYFKVQNEKSS